MVSIISSIRALFLIRIDIFAICRIASISKMVVSSTSKLSAQVISATSTPLYPTASSPSTTTNPLKHLRSAPEKDEDAIKRAKLRGFDQAKILTEMSNSLGAIKHSLTYRRLE